MNRKRFFITSILPPSLIEKHKLSTAACNFSFNLMSGGGFDETYSILGTYIGGELEPDAYRDKRFSLFYNNFFRKQGRMGIRIASIIEQWQMFMNIPKCSSVWFYNVSTLNFFLYVFLRLLKPSVLINVIELDFTPVEKGFGLNKIFIKVINGCHGNIRLAESPLFTNNNSVTLAGVVPSTCGEEPLVEIPNNRFLLSGVLQEQISQISMVLEAFSKLPQCELHITGKTNNENLIKQYADNYHNIIWHGNVSFPEYLDIMHSCTFQLSTRHPGYPENQCNFPSKIIETLLHNRIIISTIEYPQLNGIKYFAVSSDADAFHKQIEDIMNLSNEALMEYANQGKKVAEMFSTKVWNDAMTKIENV